MTSSDASRSSVSRRRVAVSRRWLAFPGVAAVATSLLVVSAPVPIAAAIAPPGPVSPALAPPNSTPGPESPMKRNKDACSVTGELPGSDLKQASGPISSLNLDQAHRLSTGAGVVVAVIDTGVRPSPRLPGMEGRGDYVAPGEQGKVDCDGHGTQVAGIIAAQPAALGPDGKPRDGLVGVAPGAKIWSYRQTSLKYSRDTGTSDLDDVNNSRTAGNIRDLARAIRRAADDGARVINVSVVSCFDVSKPIDQKMLGGALAYAVDVKDVVVVAAAGNAGSASDSVADSGCQSNPGFNPSNPQDPRNWGDVTKISTPSYFDQYVLSVGFTSANGTPSAESMVGPWVDVAAPGTGVVSLSSTDGPEVINAVMNDKRQLQPIAGTSYAAPIVSGVAALIRAKYPKMRAREVAGRIITTARQPGRMGGDGLVGFGQVDPVAALTYDKPLDPTVPIAAQSQWFKMPPPPPAADWQPAITAGVVAGLVIVGAVTISLVSVATRRPVKTKRK